MAHVSLLGGDAPIAALGSYLESATYHHSKGLSAMITEGICRIIEIGEHPEDEATLGTQRAFT